MLLFPFAIPYHTVFTDTCFTYSPNLFSLLLPLLHHLFWKQIRPLNENVDSLKHPSCYTYVFNFSLKKKLHDYACVCIWFLKFWSDPALTFQSSAITHFLPSHKQLFSFPSSNVSDGDSIHAFCPPACCHIRDQSLTSEIRISVQRVSASSFSDASECSSRDS